MGVRGIHRRDDSSSQHRKQQILMQQVYGFNDVTRVFSPDSEPADITMSYYAVDGASRQPVRPERPTAVMALRVVRSRRLRRLHRDLIELMAADDRPGFDEAVLTRGCRRIDRPFMVYVSTYAGIALASVHRRRMTRLEQTRFTHAVRSDHRFIAGLCSGQAIEFVVRGLSGAPIHHLPPVPHPKELILASLVVTAVALTPAGLVEPQDVVPWSRIEDLAIRSAWSRRVARHEVPGPPTQTDRRYGHSGVTILDSGHVHSRNHRRAIARTSQ
jgi:hypothetical protein